MSQELKDMIKIDPSVSYGSVITNDRLYRIIDDSIEDKMKKGAKGLNAWVERQVQAGGEVMEYVIETGERRMRPLRPEDV